MTTPDDPFQAPEEGMPPPAPYNPPPPGDYGAPPPQYGTPPQFPNAGAQQMPPSRSDYANWGLRVGSALIDGIAPAILAVVFIFAHVIIVGLLLDLVAFVWTLYNAYLGGSTGQSTGKRIMGTKLIREGDGSLLGGPLGVARVFVHIIDSIPCYIGWLWPIWDPKRQTFADKIMSTIVVKV